MGVFRVLRGTAAHRVALVALLVALGAGFVATPASATSDTGTVDTGRTSVTTDGNGHDDECKGDKCERINWCNGKGKNPGLLTSDAPMVGKGGQPKPECIKRPKIDYKCCVADQNGAANVDVAVKNLAERKYKIKVQLGNGQPVVKWVEPGATVTFRFAGVANGKYELRASVWSAGDTWCQFAVKTVTVKCAKPSGSPSSPVPSSSASSAPAPSESAGNTPIPGVTTTPVGNNTGSLPVTGAPVWALGLFGLLLLGVGAALFVGMRRRRRVRFVTA